MPGCVYVVGVWATIYIYNSRIFLVGIEVNGLHHSPVKVSLAIGSLQSSALIGRNIVALPGILGREITQALGLSHIDDVDIARHIGLSVVVVDVGSVGAQCASVPSLSVVEERTASVVNVHFIEVALNRTALVGSDDDAVALGIESQHLHHHPSATRQLTIAVGLEVEDIQMVEAITLTLENELVAVPRQERYRMKRFHILVVGLTVELSLLLARSGIVSHESAIILVAVEFKQIDRLGIRTPGRVGEVAVGGITSLEIDGLVILGVVYAYRHLVHLFPSHRIFFRRRGGDATLALSRCPVDFRDVNQRIIGHHALIHTCEGQFLSVRTPECSLLVAELITMNTRAIEHVARCVGRYALRLLSILTGHVEVVTVGWRVGR